MIPLIMTASLVGLVLVIVILSRLPFTRRYVRVRLRWQAPGVQHVGPWSSDRGTVLDAGEGGGDGDDGGSGD